MKIALAMNMPYYGDPASVNGASKGNRLLAEALAAKDHEVTALTPLLGPSSTLREENVLRALAGCGIALEAFDAGWRYRMNGVAVAAVRRGARLGEALRRALLRHAPDAVLVSCEDWAEGLLEAAIEAAPGRVVYLCLSPTYLPFGSHAFVESAAITHLLEQVSAIVAGSLYIERYIRAWSTFAPRSLYWPLWPRRDVPQMGSFDNEFVTFFNPCAVKGLPIFLDVARALGRVRFAVVPTWGTTHEDRASLSALTNVSFVEPADDIDVLFRRTRVLLMPSLFPEGLGASALEAQLRGIPVLVSNSGALPELVRDAESCLAVAPVERYLPRLDGRQIPIPEIPAQDPEPWVRALARLTSDRAFYERKAAALKASAREFLASVSVEPFESLLEEIAPSEDGQRPSGELDETGEFEQLIASLNATESALLLEWLEQPDGGAAAPSRENGTAAETSLTIPAQGPGGAGVLSYAQQRMWFVCQLLGESGAYNVPWVLELRGTLREEALERALAEIVRRHAVLRSRFELCGGELRVRGEDSPEFALGRVDLRGASEAELNRRLNREAGAPFDLASGPLFRATLFRVHPDAWVLLLAMHHIVADGWSTAVLNRELAALYAAFCEGRASPLPALGIQYSDFAAWQREWLAGAELERQTAYWRRQLEGLEPLRLEGRARTHTPGTHRAGQVHRRLGAELRTALEGLNQAAGTTLFMSLLACFAALLYRYTGREDIAVGTPIANRTRAEIEPLIGLFVNSLVLRVAVAAEDRFADLLERVRAAALGAYEHQDLPFEKLVEELHPERELSRNPLFEVMFALQNAPMWTIDLPGLAIAPRPVDPPAARLELELHAWEQDGALNLLAVYSEEVFAREWIEAMLGHFERVARQAAADPARRIGDLELLGGEERQRVLVDWNRTTAAAPPLARIDAWIWAAARRWPERIAVRAGSQARTYKQIIARATALAAHLVARGVEAEEQVAIAVGRGVELPAVMLGVFAAGAAYVPLDLRYPRARLEFMLRDSGARFLLVDPQEPAPEFNGVQPISIADLPEPPADAPLWPAPQRCTPHSLAYIIYTSGSTGQPKGVAVEHAGVTALAAWTGEVFSPRELAGLVASTSLCFDVAVFELLTPLAHGGQVRIVPDALQLDAAETLHAKSNLDPDPDGPWMLSTVPSAAWELARSHRIPPWLRTMVLAGEVLSPALVAELRRHGVRRIVNAYGPTEDTVFSTWAEIDPRQEASVPIGRPIPFSRAYVLDARMQPQPAGVAGELWLGGAGVARGYFNRPELTAQRFRGDPFAALHSSPAPELDAQPPRLYRSGDLARWRSDGQIEYLGRLDQQIKLRGFRIEPAEIELTLRAHPAVRDCAVALHNGALAAWIVPAANTPDSGSETEQLDDWRILFDSTYEDSQPGDFNVAGWNDSYSGQPLPSAEMRAWRDNTLHILREVRSQRVLEIGCGTGLLLLELAAEAAAYTATDISPAGLAQVREMVQRRRLANVNLSRGAAHTFEPRPGEAYDLVILNSVVQYFPGIHYLGEVIRKAVRATRDGGRIFLGDIRSLPLLEVLHRELVERRAANELSPRALGETAHRAAWREKELAIDPAWFGLLREFESRIGAVEVRLKRGRYRNELARFRYDVILHVGQPHVESIDHWFDWSGWSDLEDRLGRAACFGLRGIPNQRIASAPDGEGVDPETLIELAAATGHRAHLGWSAAGTQGSMDAVFCTLSSPPAVVELPVVRSAAPGSCWARFATDPLRARSNDRAMGQLRSFLEARLPDFMAPAHFIDVARLPHTSSGKIDRAALPSLLGARPEDAGRAIEPRTPTEKRLADIWKQVLGIRQAGVQDDFFRLGGHSLLATQIMSRIRVEFGIDLPLREIFLRPTIARLAGLIDERLWLAAPSLVTATVEEGEL